MKRRRLISLFLVLLLAAGLPLTALAENAPADHTYSIANGDITVTAALVNGQNVQTVEQGGKSYTDDAPVFTGSTAAYSISITAEAGAAARVTISALSIDRSDTGWCSVSTLGEGEPAIKVSGEGSAVIELDGTNTLEGGPGVGALDSSAAMLTLSDDNGVAGSLNAAGKNNRYGRGKGICATRLTVTGGKVTAIGSDTYPAIYIRTQDTAANNVVVSGSAQLTVQGGSTGGLGGEYPAIGNWSPFGGTELTPDASGLTDGWIAYYAPGTDRSTGLPTKVLYCANGQSVTCTENISLVEALAPTETEEGHEAGYNCDGTLVAVVLPKVEAAEPDSGVYVDRGYTTDLKDDVLTITVKADDAILTGELKGMKALGAEGVKTVVFVTNQATSMFDIADLLEKGALSDIYKLTHKGEKVSFVNGTVYEDIRSILK